MAEIDIVAESNSEIVFVEVKYRSNSAQGSGFEYITTAKRKQIVRAARYYLIENPTELRLRIVYASVTGEAYHVRLREDYYFDGRII